jgi:hypothetical protein
VKWLARLKTESAESLQATKPTKSLRQNGQSVFVDFVAGHPPHDQNIDTENPVAAVRFIDVKPGPDQTCWPYSPAMNGQEIDLFLSRLAHFTDKGWKLVEAEQLADKLLSRDREKDDRRLCLECSHLKGIHRWRCGNWRQADMAVQVLTADLVPMLQRCRGFNQR